MNIKGVIVAAALAFAGAAFAAPTTFAGHEFGYYDISKVPALTFASQSRQNFYNHDIYVRYDLWGNNGRGASSLQSIYSVPDSKWKGPSNGHVAPVPEPETYALMLAGLLVVFMVARRRRPTS